MQNCRAGQARFFHFWNNVIIIIMVHSKGRAERMHLSRLGAELTHNASLLPSDRATSFQLVLLSKFLFEKP